MNFHDDLESNKHLPPLHGRPGLATQQLAMAVRAAQFRFRLRFDWAPGFHIDSAESILEIPVRHSEPLRLKSVPDGSPLSESSTLVLTGGPYPSEQSALANGRRARTALLAFALEQRKGVDLGSDETRGGLFEAGKRLLFPDEDPALIHNEVYGLSCFEDRPGTKFVSASASVCIRTAPSHLTELVAESFSREEPFAPAVETALELYAASHFDPSPRPRFLTLLNAIECLISRESKAPEVLSFLNELGGQVSASGLAKTQKEGLTAALRDLRRESIRQAGRRLAVEALGEAQFAGDSAQDFFDKCYARRSSMLHGGKGGARPKDIASLIGELDRFVVELIRSAMRA